MFGGGLRSIVQRFAARAAGTVAAAILVALLFLFAFAFLLIALDLWLSPHQGAPLAALETGLAAIVLAAAVMIVSRAVMRKPPRPKYGEFERELGEFVGIDTAKRILHGIERHGMTAAFVALGAGLLVGASPRVRKLLRFMLKI